MTYVSEVQYLKLNLRKDGKWRDWLCLIDLEQGFKRATNHLKA